MSDAHPIHPGSYIRENVLEPRGLTVSEAAKLIGVSLSLIHISEPTRH